MKRFTWPVLLILVSCLADVFINASSEAAVQGTITLMRDPTIGVPFTSPDATLSAPWVSYALGLRSTAGTHGRGGHDRHARWLPPTAGAANR